MLGGGLCSGRLESAERFGVKLIFPVDGLVLTHGYDLSPRPGLQVPLLGVAPPGARVWVNGAEAEIIGIDRENRPGGPNVTFARAGSGFYVHYGVRTEFVSLKGQTLFLFELEVAEPVVGRR